MRKQAFGICENKDADQFCGNREDDLRLCFHYTDSTIPLLAKLVSALFFASQKVQSLYLRSWSAPLFSLHR